MYLMEQQRPQLRMETVILQSLITGRTSFLLACLGLVLAAPALEAQQWTTPTTEERAMTLQVGAPEAPAVLLYREETSDDSLRMFSYYVRLKILTEGWEGSR